MRLWRSTLGWVLVVGALLAAGAVPAAATTPGRNGPLAFELYTPKSEFNGQVARIAPDGSHRQILTTAAAGEPPEPDWSPDARRIAFVRCTGEESSCNIWVMRRDGSHERQVTDCAPRWCFGNLSPTWAPDGTHIVFERDQR